MAVIREKYKTLFCRGCKDQNDEKRTQIIHLEEHYFLIKCKKSDTKDNNI